MSGKSKRGFASMDPSRQRDIASKGGKAAHAKGTAHEWTADEARRAIETEGLVTTTKTTGAVHVHPLVKVEREARAQFMKIWGELQLRWDREIDGGGKWGLDRV